MTAEIDPIAAQRPRLFGLAYRMLGSAAQAEDAVQETYARWYAQPRDEVRNEAAFLTTIVTRLCLDQLKSARAQREDYPGVWLPEPLAVEPEALQAEIVGAPAQHSVESELERLESISLAFMALLESLTPLERAVYLLHEVFGYSHGEAAQIIDRSEGACRQIHRRAKRSLRSRKPAAASPERHRELLTAFLAACQQGDLHGLTRLLAEDVVSRADGGGRAAAANRPVVGARAVARLYYGFARRMDPGTRVQIRSINGWPSLVLSTGERLRSVIQVHSDGECIDAIHAITNPAKLARLAGELGLHTTSG